MGQLQPDEMQWVSQYESAFQDKRFKQASALASSLVDAAPAQAEYWFLRGKARLKSGKLDDALADFAQAVFLDQASCEYLTHMGAAFIAKGDHDSGDACFQRALQIDEAYLDAQLRLGRLREQQGRMEEAQVAFMRALVAHPDSAAACHYTAKTLHFQGRKQDAAALFSRAIQNDPDMPEPYRILAAYLREAGDLQSAVGMYDALLKRCPDDEIAKVERAHCLAHLNDWANPGYRDFAPGTSAQLTCGASPFLYLAFEDDPKRHRVRSKRYARRVLGHVQPAKAKPTGNKKLRIGYFSADYHDHATMHLLAGVLEAHDKSQLEVFAYSYGPEIPKDHMRARAVAAVDKFTDVAGMGDYRAAELARQDGIDIAIDLKGFTGDTQIGIFAHRAAPIQVAWLGFPGTTGARCIDYLIADETVLPPKYHRHFSERIISLPDCYQPNDPKRPLPDPAMTRADAGLPDAAFVFCSFNSSYKISPTEFDIWMQLLCAVDDSVLWQLDCGEISQVNFRAAAQAAGIDPDRIIFAPRLPQKKNLARLAMADLFLDTFNCNAHTTASDALWAGVPVLTLPGRQFAARVAASLVKAAGIPEMICTSPQHYHERAMSLAQDRDSLSAVKEKLITGRTSSALFDTERFTRNLESALLKLPKNTNLTDDL